MREREREREGEREREREPARSASHCNNVCKPVSACELSFESKTPARRVSVQPISGMIVCLSGQRRSGRQINKEQPIQPISVSTPQRINDTGSASRRIRGSTPPRIGTSDMSEIQHCTNCKHLHCFSGSVSPTRLSEPTDSRVHSAANRAQPAGSDQGEAIHTRGTTPEGAAVPVKELLTHPRLPFAPLPPPSPAGRGGWGVGGGGAGGSVTLSSQRTRSVCVCVRARACRLYLGP